MWNWLKKHNITAQLLALIIVLSSISFYNLFTQREVLLQQMRIDSAGVVNSINSSISRFEDIRATISLQKLVRDVSLELEIFEFRYLDKNGVVINSMFKDEIGQQFTRPRFVAAMKDSRLMNKFYFDERDYVKVMGITYPVSVNNEMVGIIDLSVDISEYEYVKGQQRAFSLSRREVDIRNLLTSVAGSIRNSLEIYRTAEVNSFLSTFVRTTRNIKQVSLLDQRGYVVMSSEARAIGTQVSGIPESGESDELIESGGELIYRLITPGTKERGVREHLLLLLDAAPYANNERRLTLTAIITSALIIMMAAFIAFSIYRYNLKQVTDENRRLEAKVQERTREIELLSKTDGLTGLWNRRHLEDMMILEFQRSRRYGHDLSFLILDLDHFKHVNDSHGHLAGDEVLREVAKRVTTALRKTDFVGRYGGEEIVIMLTDTNLGHAMVVGEKLRKVIADTPVTFEGKQIPVTASIGISVMTGEHKTPHDTLEKADVALYESKKNGRNRVTTLMLS